MKKIAVITTTRAEYGLLSPIVKGLISDGEFDVRVVASGTHVSAEYGDTYLEIEKDGIIIDQKIDILSNVDTPRGVSITMSNTIARFADYFESRRPDAIVVLGDRYETLGVAIAAMNERIPIIHLHGGETTEGAIDEGIRHAITKLSYLHLTSTEEFRHRVVQLGEQPDRVITVGAPGIENIIKTPLMTKEELEESIGFKLDRDFAVVTFHPVTLESSTAEAQYNELLEALDLRDDMKYIITKANADCDGRKINQMTDEYVVTRENVVAFESLGLKRYLSSLKYASMVIGNSSSGILEAPSFGIPTINIGDRQKGRPQATSVINCKPNRDEIINAIEYAESDDFKKVCVNTINPYGDGNTSSKVITAIKEMFDNGVDLKKKFYDI